MSNSAPTPPVEVAPRAVQQAAPRAREIDVELLALDLAECTRSG